MVEPIKKSLKSCYGLIFKTLQDALTKSFSEITEKIILTPSSNAKYDYQSPSAVRLFNSHKKDGTAFGLKSAKELASKILEQIDLKNQTLIEKIDLNEAGFLSIKVNDSFAEEFVNSVLRLGPAYLTETPQTIVVDFSSPNIAKEMHVGHMRSTIIGESICRILEFMGNKVLRVNHVGDWGTQFGMLIAYMQKVYPDYLVNMPPLKDLQAFYKASKNEFDKDAEFKKVSQLTVVKLQSGDPDCIKAWQIICDISRQEFMKIYKRLHINVEEYGESFYNSRIPAVIKECEDKGIVQLSEGAKCIFVEGFTNPIMIQKSDGGFNYDSTDMAAVRYRLLELNAERIIYITDSGQETHFFAIFEAAKLMGWHKPPQTRLDHMGFGVILGSDGKRFKTRSGETVKLNDLLEEAFANCKRDLVKRLSENKEGSTTNLVEEEIDDAAEKIGMAALKYFDLKQTRQTDYKFEYDKMLDLKGNTAVYLIYSYVRLCSILRKSGLTEAQLNEIIEKDGFKFTHNQEKVIANTLMRFPETLDTVVDELAIHKLCDFIYAISTKIAEGYNKYRIIDDPNKNSRILLCEACRRIMKEALYMVGIVPVEKI